MPKPLAITQLDHHYNDEQIYASVDLDVNDGNLIAVLGESGCGKTTLLRAIAGLITPTTGSIRIGNDLVADQGKVLIPIERRRIGLVFQDYALFPYMSVQENIGFGLTQPDQKRVDDLLELTGIAELANRRPQKLSGGQQQRVALSRALAPKPHLLLLDEPFANVDASRRTQLGQSLVQTLSQEGRAGLFVTHDQSDAMSHASRVAVFTEEDGVSSIRQCDSPEVVFRKPRTKAVARLLSPASFIQAEANGSQAVSALRTHPLQQEAKRTVELMYRSDELSFVPKINGKVHIISRNYLGTHYRMTCDTPARPFVYDSNKDGPAIGSVGNLLFSQPAWTLPRT